MKEGHAVQNGEYAREGMGSCFLCLLKGSNSRFMGYTECVRLQFK